MPDTAIDTARADTDEIARRYAVPADAVATLVAAIRRGGGRQAQFSHPALGGMGQWSRGGGTMIGDMFNHALKAKVEELCNAIAQEVDKPAAGIADIARADDWWPRDLGRPSSTGSQDGEAYAFFSERRRLAIRDGDGVRLYETGDHRIGGVSQQQGNTRDLVFTSQHGRVRVADLAPVGEAPAESSSSPLGSKDARSSADARSSSSAAASGDDPLALLERLHELQRKGVITAEEFATKKRELLARL